MNVANMPGTRLAEIPKPRRRNVILTTPFGKYYWLQRYGRVLYYKDGRIRDKPTWTGTLSTSNNSLEGATRKAAAQEFHRLNTVLYRD